MYFTNILKSKQFSTILLTFLLTSIMFFGLYIYSILFFSTEQILGQHFFKNLTKSDISLLNQVSRNVDLLYYNKDDISNLEDNSNKINGLISGYVDSLGDKHTEYLTPDVSESFDEMIEGGFEGIGTYIEKSKFGILITGILDESPAEKSGLKVGDIIYKANNNILQDMPIEKAVTYIKGKAGTKVDLEIIRSNQIDNILISVTRESIDIPSVKSEIKNDIMHIELSIFDENAENNIKELLTKAKNDNLKGIILDLRMNGGGLLGEAVGILSLFIKKGEPLVVTRNKDLSFETTIYSRGGFDINIPLVVLIDEYSASASEITAGVLREYKKATIVGVTSYGKGSVQDLIDLSNGGALKLTIAHWFTPNDAPIEGVGVKPDIEVKLTEQDYIDGYDRQLEMAREFLLNK